MNEVVLDPFFLSKYEMTVGQWKRTSRWSGRFERDEALLPVHGVSQDDCVATLRTAGLFLRLPTEAQGSTAVGRERPRLGGRERPRLRSGGRPTSTSKG
jgi:formylglycine-generating enzyme required for sulfatase activity